MGRNSRLRDHFKPEVFADALSIVDSLQQGKAAIVDFQAMEDLEEAQRTIDFIAGANYVLDGCQLKFAVNVFGFGKEPILKEYRRSLMPSSIANNALWRET